uniref:Uncharacterized protein n=1 Tax=Octopus bimaculoides TaxID=37653 RepID=A0A0L8HVJ4_OCTBM
MAFQQCDIRALANLLREPAEDSDSDTDIVCSDYSYGPGHIGPEKNSKDGTAEKG